MASKTTVNILIYGTGLLFVAALAYIGLGGKHGDSGGGAGGLYISGWPRTQQPLGNYTRYFTPKTFAVEGGHASLTYHWFQPAGGPYPAGLKFPLVVVLHGAPGFAYAAEYLVAPKMQTVFPAFIAVPVLPQNMKWDMPDALPDVPHYAPTPAKQKGMPYTADLVKSLAAQYPIDPSRIYIVGCSDGGAGVLGAAMKYPDLFAAGIAISGTWNAQDTPKMTKMPLWVIHGTQDQVSSVGIARKVVNGIKQSGGSAAYSEIPEMAQDCSAPRLYTQATWDWLFKQHK